VQDCVGSWRDLVKAVRASINTALCQFVELAFCTTRRAIHCRAAKANLHDMFKAGVIIREAFKELANRKFRA